ncbi:MAG: hypothetical protein RL514_1631 [Verrucomicrobiota bacterium]|jgi:HD-like signal output (HDOD) protein
MSKPEKPSHRALLHYLELADPAKRWPRDRMLEVFEAGDSFPSFSAAVLKLTRLAKDEAVGMDELADLISKEPGLATNCIRAASTSRFGRGVVRSVRGAALRLGTQEISRVACSLGVMDRFNHLRVTVDWQRFWLHSLLVARISDQIAAAFRQSTGMEYLAGLLHDAGKLLIEHYLSREYETVLERAWSHKRGHFIAEREVLAIDHAQIGAALCHCLQVHPQVRAAVWFHHDPTNPRLLQMAGGDKGFLAAVVGFADVLAHKASETLGHERRTDTPYDELPEWRQLIEFDPIHGLELDTENDLAAAEADLKAFT